MNSYVAPAVLAFAAFFAAVGDAWADDIASHLDHASAPLASGGQVQSARGPAWTINDYVNARNAGQSPARITISVADDGHLIDDAARSL